MTDRLAARLGCADLAVPIAADDAAVDLIRGLPVGAVRFMSPDRLHCWFG